MRLPPRQPRKMVGSAGAAGRRRAADRPSSCARLADLRQIRRADLLAGLDDEFCIEAELAAPDIANRAQRRHVDAVLALVVGGAAAIDAIALDRGLPWIEIVAPFADHAAHDIAMTVGQEGWQRGVLTIVRQQIGAPAGRGFDQPGREIQRSECRLQILHEIGAQRRAARGILTLGAIAQPAI